MKVKNEQIQRSSNTRPKSKNDSSEGENSNKKYFLSESIRNITNNKQISSLFGKKSIKSKRKRNIITSANLNEANSKNILHSGKKKKKQENEDKDQEEDGQEIYLLQGVKYEETEDCKNNCSDRGICLQGKCVCPPNYTLDDCSMTINQIQDGYTIEAMLPFIICSAVLGMIFALLINIFSSQNPKLKDHLNIE